MPFPKLARIEFTTRSSTITVLTIFSFPNVELARYLPTSRLLCRLLRNCWEQSGMSGRREAETLGQKSATANMNVPAEPPQE